MVCDTIHCPPFLPGQLLLMQRKILSRCFHLQFGYLTGVTGIKVAVTIPDILLPSQTCNGSNLLCHSVCRFTLILFHDSLLLFTYEHAHCNAIIGGCRVLLRVHTISLVTVNDAHSI